MQKSRFRSPKSFKRTAPSRTPNKCALIVCEADSTEYAYLESFRKDKRLLSVDVAPVSKEEAPSPADLVFAARGIQKKRAKDEKYDDVWIVFGKDDHKSIPTAFQLAWKNKFNVAFSNPAFELWLLWHVEDQPEPLELEDAVARLKNHIPDYEPGMKGIYESLSGRLDEAVRRAEALRDLHSRSRGSEAKNPSSGVDKLIKALL